MTAAFAAICALALLFAPSLVLAAQPRPTMPAKRVRP